MTLTQPSSQPQDLSSRDGKTGKSVRCACDMAPLSALSHTNSQHPGSPTLPIQACVQRFPAPPCPLKLAYPVSHYLEAYSLFLS